MTHPYIKTLDDAWRWHNLLTRWAILPLTQEEQKILAVAETKLDETRSNSPP